MVAQHRARRRAGRPGSGRWPRPPPARRPGADSPSRVATRGSTSAASAATRSAISAASARPPAAGAKSGSARSAPRLACRPARVAPSWWSSETADEPRSSSPSRSSTSSHPSRPSWTRSCATARVATVPSSAVSVAHPAMAGHVVVALSTEEAQHLELGVLAVLDAAEHLDDDLLARRRPTCSTARPRAGARDRPATAAPRPVARSGSCRRARSAVRRSASARPSAAPVSGSTERVGLVVAGPPDQLVPGVAEVDHGDDEVATERGVGHAGDRLVRSPSPRTSAGGAATRRWEWPLRSRVHHRQDVGGLEAGGQAHVVAPDLPGEAVAGEQVLHLEGRRRGRGRPGRRTRLPACCAGRGRPTDRTTSSP